MSWQPIEEYGIIGNLETIALVARNGSVDFMCLPGFDSPTIFAALLDDEKGGQFSIAPVGKPHKNTQFYLPDSNILLTRFFCSEGMGEISDFMSMEETHSLLIRRVKCIRGELRVRMVCVPRFNYARTNHRIESKNDQEVLFVPDDPGLAPLSLRSFKPFRVQGGMVTAEFSLRCGESVPFLLEAVSPDHELSPLSKEGVTRSFKNTLNFWRQWVGKSSYTGHWRDHVTRSALVLKLLTCRSDGAIVAAPTFGLPERIGGRRNWDYRATWIRDASFTLYAFIRLGYTQEAEMFMTWLNARCAELEPEGSLQVLYRLNGQHQFEETELKHLKGYRHSQPVRIGNEAYRQRQLDIYGPLMDSVYLYDLDVAPVSYDLWKNLVRLINWIGDHWYLKDAGIWESRMEWEEFLYSRLMCWVAMDRGIRLAVKRSFPAPLDHWQEVRNLIFQNIMNEFWDSKRKIFVRATGSQHLDAACLLMPLVGFISPQDPRWLSTLNAIEHELISDALVFRHQSKDEDRDRTRKEEGTFSMCSFWYVECLSRAGDFQKARLYFEKMLGYANHVGLYAEELGTSSEHLGNYPQALTHLALIRAAFELSRQLDSLKS